MRAPQGRARRRNYQDDKTIEIRVNNKPVLMPKADKEPNGREIKAEAIRQGVAIEANFVLQLELPNGTSKIIGDDDEVRNPIPAPASPLSGRMTIPDGRAPCEVKLHRGWRS